VIVLPDGFPNYAVQDFGEKGKRALRDWVNAGGRLVAWQGGALVATKAGISTAHFSTSNTNAPGALIRVSLDDASPLAEGVGELDWVMYQDDDVMRPGLGAAAATFPSAAQDAAATVVDFGSAIRVRVAAADAAATAKILSRRGAEVVRINLGNEVLFLVANRKDLSAEESPLFAFVVRDLDKAGIDVLAASVP